MRERRKNGPDAAASDAVAVHRADVAAYDPREGQQSAVRCTTRQPGGSWHHSLCSTGGRAAWSRRKKRPLRSRFGCRRHAPSERRRLRPSRGTIIHGPVHDSPTGRLVAPRPLLSWWLRRVEPVEKRPLRFRFGCRGRAPSECRRLKPSRGVIIGGPVHDSPTKGLVASRPLLGWRPRCMELAEKRPLRSHFG